MRTFLSPNRRSPPLRGLIGTVGRTGRGDSLRLSTDAFSNGGFIPVKYTKISPALQWHWSTPRPPAGITALALIVDDPDAPRDRPYVHWAVYIPNPNISGISEGSSCRGCWQLPNTSGHAGYTGPHPPKGSGIHHYRFQLSALSQSLTASQLRHMSGEDLQDWIRAVGASAFSQLVGLYSRSEK